jgi:hypothetical protein
MLVEPLDAPDARRRALDVSGAQKGPLIGVQKGPAFGG